jgi:ABC-type multidrug transport system fused ATPase/permease subunit
MKEIFYLTLIVGGIIWVLGWTYWVLLSRFSANLTYRVKKMYLEAILKQECAWYDQINHTELSSKIARETAHISKGYGEKAGNVTLAIGTFISGIVVGFWMGWGLALAMMVLIPFVGGMGFMFEKMMSQSTSQSLRFYS